MAAMYCVLCFHFGYFYQEKMRYSLLSIRRGRLLEGGARIITVFLAETKVHHLFF